MWLILLFWPATARRHKPQHHRMGNDQLATRSRRMGSPRLPVHTRRERCWLACTKIRTRKTWTAARLWRRMDFLVAKMLLRRRRQARPGDGGWTAVWGAVETKQLIPATLSSSCPNPMCCHSPLEAQMRTTLTGCSPGIIARTIGNAPWIGATANSQTKR